MKKEYTKKVQFWGFILTIIRIKISILSLLVGCFLPSCPCLQICSSCPCLQIWSSCPSLQICSSCPCLQTCSSCSRIQSCPCPCSCIRRKCCPCPCSWSQSHCYRSWLTGRCCSCPGPCPCPRSYCSKNCLFLCSFVQILSPGSHQVFSFLQK